MQELNTQFIKKKKNEKWSIKIEKKAKGAKMVLFLKFKT